MPNKTICAQIALLIIAVASLFTEAPYHIVYSCLTGIGILGGISIWRNSHPH